MNNLIANFEQILEFAKSYGLPLTKKRAILREYLQSKTLELIYQSKISSQIYFVGGTALRLLYNLNRFSEDLDFDLGNIGGAAIDQLVKSVVSQLKKESLSLDFYRNKTKNRVYYELRFKDLLFELNISRDPKEKLMIKLDFEKFWQKQKRQVYFFNRYGFFFNIVSVTLNQHLTQKLWAYLNRKQTQPRDIYDITWLIGQKAKLDASYTRTNKLPKEIISLAIKKFEDEKNKLPIFKRRLKPFLIKEKSAEKLVFFPQLLNLIR